SIIEHLYDFRTKHRKSIASWQAGCPARVPATRDRLADERFAQARLREIVSAVSRRRGRNFSRISLRVVRLLWAERLIAATQLPARFRIGTAIERNPFSNSSSTIEKPCARSLPM